MKEAPVTIVVPFYNEELFLAQKLDNCARLGGSLVTAVIFVDDSSVDGGAHLLARGVAEKKGSMRVLENAFLKGKTGAIKTGVGQAQSKYVLVTDADILLEEDAVSKLVEAMEHDARLGLVFGEINRYASVTQFIIHKLLRMLSRIDSAVSCTGQCYLFRKDLDLDVDERMISDDVDLPIQARRKGFLCRMIPAVVFRDSRGGVSDGAADRRRILGIYQSLLKHKTLFLNPAYGRYGMICFPAMFLFFPAACIVYLGGLLSISFWLFTIHPLWCGLFLAGIFGLKRPRTLTIYVFRTLVSIVAFLWTRNALVAWHSDPLRASRKEAPYGE